MSHPRIIIGTHRHKIEDDIVRHYEAVGFASPRADWLEDRAFWDYIFSWYALAKYYEDSGDTAVGAHIVALFAHSVAIVQAAAGDAALSERQRGRAADAAYQITYYVNQIMLHVDRNALALSEDDSVGRIDWPRQS